MNIELIAVGTCIHSSIRDWVTRHPPPVTRHPLPSLDMNLFNKRVACIQINRYSIARRAGQKYIVFIIYKINEMRSSK